MKRFVTDLYNEFIRARKIEIKTLHQNLISIVKEIIKTQIPGVNIFVNEFSTPDEELCWFLASIADVRSFKKVCSSIDASSQINDHKTFQAAVYNFTSSKLQALC